MTVKADPAELAGRRVLISGGTKGLGHATVERFLAGGAGSSPLPAEHWSRMTASTTSRRT